MSKNALRIIGMICWLLLLAPGLFAQENLLEKGNGVSQKGAEMQSPQVDEPLVWLGCLVLGIGLLAAKHAHQHLTRSKTLSQQAIRKLQQERRRLLQELARFDELYEMKKIPEHLYLSESQDRRQQLVELTLLCERSS